MKILLNKDDLFEALKSASNLGFVPTMGSLHKGHVSLIKRSKKDHLEALVLLFCNGATLLPEYIDRGVQILREDYLLGGMKCQKMVKIFRLKNIFLA